MHDRARVQRGPLTRNDRDVGEVCRGSAVAMVVACHRMRIVGGSPGKAVRRNKLGVRAPRISSAPPTTGTAAPRRAGGPTDLAVGYQRDVDDPGVDRRQRMVYVHFERATA